MNPPPHPPSDSSPDTPVEPLVPPTPTPPLEASVPAQPPLSVSAPTRRRAKTEDFAFLSRLPARKPETFDDDALKRAALMVAGLAFGLWLITLIAQSNRAPEPEPTPTPGALMQQAPPIVMPGGNAPAAPQTISLTPAPLLTPQPVVTPPPYARPAPMRRTVDDPAGQRYPAATFDQEETDVFPEPTAADTTDPSNLFPD